MKLIKFIEMPDQLSNLDMDALRGGRVAAGDTCTCNSGSAFACGTYS
jgi:hypothetical protein